MSHVLVHLLSDGWPRIAASATGAGQGVRRDDEREAAVALAPRFGLVREECPGLLQSRGASLRRTGVAGA
ncbi:hypothetical protein ACOT81_41955 [Streptomyces sp. WI04-05B]|uniref:hypothetical protein n=1 Tax=Streptomyces TaxID=1883 RepID=UPI0029BD09B0|nr:MULTISPECIES: hypothetical protein [unclassified Streptomyces]MDX2543510.1 hypothetical protein [Streptomyces sp. WI04-05B]MDX2583002.1 hypothetical protein [Streptomyces sp. WI04-05A]